MPTPHFISETPVGFWSELAKLDGKLRRRATRQPSPWYLPSRYEESWAHMIGGNDESRVAEGAKRIVSWGGYRWLGPLSLRGRLKITDTSPGMEEVDPALGKLNIFYKCSHVTDTRILGVERPTHTSIYTAGRSLDNVRRLAGLFADIDPGPTITQEDCQLVLDEMAIGAAGAFRILPKAPTDPQENG